MIFEFNRNMPPAYQIGVDKREIHLYLINQVTGNEIPVRKSIKVLKQGTKTTLKHYLEGMLGSLDIAKSFQDFQERLEKVQKERKNAKN